MMIRIFAPSPIARRLSELMTRTRVLLSKCSTPSLRHRYPCASPRASRANSSTMAAWGREALTKTFSTPSSNRESPGVRLRATRRPQSQLFPLALGKLRAAISGGLLTLDTASENACWNGNNPPHLCFARQARRSAALLARFGFASPAMVSTPSYRFNVPEWPGLKVLDCVRQWVAGREKSGSYRVPRPFPRARPSANELT